MNVRPAASLRGGSRSHYHAWWPQRLASWLATLQQQIKALGLVKLVGSQLVGSPFFPTATWWCRWLGWSPPPSVWVELVDSLSRRDQLQPVRPPYLFKAFREDLRPASSSHFRMAGFVLGSGSGFFLAWWLFLVLIELLDNDLKMPSF